MANPVSKGIGTGAAQVYDYSRIDNAMNNAFRSMAAKDAAAEAKKEAKEAAKRKAEAKLRGDLKFDTSKIKDVDKDVVKNMVQTAFSEMDGHWEDINNGDPEWTNNYIELTSGIKNYISSSANEKVKEDNLFKTMNAGSDTGYSEDAKNKLIEAMATPGFFAGQFNDSGLSRRDQVIGNPYTKVDAAFEKGSDVLYKDKDYSVPNAQGGQTTVEGKEWLPDDEAFPKFMSNVMSTPELVNDVRIQYGNPGEDVTEDQVRDFYNDYKSTRQKEWEKTRITKDTAEEPTSKYKKGGITDPAYFKESKGEGFKISPTTGTQLKPIDIILARTKDLPERIAIMRPSAIWKDFKNGQWYIRGVSSASIADLEKKFGGMTKEEREGLSFDDWKETQAKGQFVNEPITSNVLASLKTTYGLGDLDEILEEINPESKSNDEARKQAKSISNDEARKQAKESGYDLDEYIELLKGKGFKIKED